ISTLFPYTTLFRSLFTFKNSLPFLKKIMGFSSQVDELEQLSENESESDDTNLSDSLVAPHNAQGNDEVEIAQDDQKSEQEIVPSVEFDDNSFQVTDSRTEENIEEQLSNPVDEIDDMEVTNTLENDDDESEFVTSELHDYDPTLDLSHYKLPHIDLLENHQSSSSEVSADELSENKKKIEDTLRNYNIE